jgi:hypothetical protein
MFQRRQSTQAAATLPTKQQQVITIPEGGIHPATTADVGAQGKALDTDDLVIFLIVFGFVWTIAVVAYSWNQGLALGLSVIVWTVGGIILCTLLLFIQSRTWVQTWNSWLHWMNERKRIGAQERVLTIYYKSEVKRERIRVEGQVLIAEINERLRLAAQAELVRQVEEHSQPQSTMNQVANYVAPLEEIEPFFDELRDRLVRYLVERYQGQDKMQDDGRILGEIPWGKRGKMPADRVRDMLKQAETWCGVWVVRYDTGRKGWYVNIDKFETPTQMVAAFDRVRTPRV